LDIGVLGYIGIVQHKEHPPEVFHIPPGTPCIYCCLLLSVFQFSRILCLDCGTLNLKVVGKIGVKGKPVLWVAACSYCVRKISIQRYQYF